MLIRFSNNIIHQVRGVMWHNRYPIMAYTGIAVFFCVLYELHLRFDLWMPNIPIFPISILGGALAIFLGFRNNSAYDRWWEARKVWGAIVNNSRTFAMYVISYSSEKFSNGEVEESEIKKWRKRMIYRHLAWVYTLINQLRKDAEHEVGKYLSKEERKRIRKVHNPATHIINFQAADLKNAYECGIIEDFRHMELGNMLKTFYDEQGKSERIKNTIFPFYYNYFTRVFLWIFIICLPMTLVPDMGWGTVPMAVAISFVFTILEKSGTLTEDPFEGRAADTPLYTIGRNIEIDLMEMLEDEIIPKPVPVVVGRFGVLSAP